MLDPLWCCEWQPVLYESSHSTQSCISLFSHQQSPWGERIRIHLETWGTVFVYSCCCCLFYGRTELVFWGGFVSGHRGSRTDWGPPHHICLCLSGSTQTHIPTNLALHKHILSPVHTFLSQKADCWDRGCVCRRVVNIIANFDWTTTGNYTLSLSTALFTSASVKNLMSYCIAAVWTVSSIDCIAEMST